MFNLNRDAYSDGPRHYASPIPRIIFVPAEDKAHMHNVLEQGEHALEDGNHFDSHELVERGSVLERVDPCEVYVERGLGAQVGLLKSEKLLEPVPIEAYGLVRQCETVKLAYERYNKKDHVETEQLDVLIPLGLN